MNTKLSDNDLNLFSFSENKPNVDKNIIVHEDFIKEIFTSTVLPFDKKFSLKTEAHLLEFAYAYNKIMSLSNSRTRILAHQVESTHKIVDALNQRFLIADEVGLGKTVEAGLVIKEFIYRFEYNRILIACPASLLFQWQNEMLSKFNEEFIIMDRKLLNKAQKIVGEKGNPWTVYNKIICSLDFIKNHKFQQDLGETQWDTVIFDEAHRLRRDSKHSTQAFNAAEIIGNKSKALLLLTATPFRGNLEELYYLISLIDKNILGPFNSFYNDYCIDNSNLAALKEKISPAIIRRTKKEVGGFTIRHARTIKFELYPDERHLYDETTTYVAEEFNRALQTENRAVGFVMTVFQKLLDSSSHALLSALQNRVIRLNEMIKKTEECKAFEENYFDEHDIDESEDIDFTATVNNDKTIEELKIEIMTIKRLISIAERIRINKKGEKLVELIKKLRSRGNKKFLIFTQFRTTQDYLASILNDFKVAIFNGSMDRDQKEQAIIDFKEDVEILIATEAGGEGRNMQFTNILINYDLPWSPLKIEQRIGRLHRFGQKKDVFIYNFSTKETVAERVLEVLTNKLRLFEESIGTPDIMLGQIEDELQLNSLFMNFATGKKDKKIIDEEIKERMKYAQESYQRLAELTVTNKMDFNYDEYYRITLKDRQFCNNRIENFVNNLRFESAFVNDLIGEKHSRNGLYPIKSTTHNELNKYGTYDSQTALDNENLEFLAFGHPIINELILHCKKKEFGGLCGIKTMKFHKNFHGLICNYIITYKSKTTTHEIIPVVISVHHELDSFDQEDAEKESTEQLATDSIKLANYLEAIDDIKNNAGLFFSMAGMRIMEKVKRRILDISDNLDIHIDPELEKIKNSYTKSLKELYDKLSLQEGQMKWYGKDMRSVISRTKNKIFKTEQEYETIVEQYKSYMGVKYTIELLNAGVIIAEQ